MRPYKSEITLFSLSPWRFKCPMEDKQQSVPTAAIVQILFSKMRPSSSLNMGRRPAPWLSLFSSESPTKNPTDAKSHKRRIQFKQIRRTS